VHLHIQVLNDAHVKLPILFIYIYTYERNTVNLGVSVLFVG